MDFDRPAQVTWREVLVEVDKSKSRAEARKKADTLLARIRRGEDFVALARTESDGPNKSDGGLWQTTPGSYGVPAVNAALDSLPVGQVSSMIEGPTSYHIVRVESRRQAGPAPFYEAQERVHRVLRQQKIRQQSTAYLEKLRNRTIIRTVFDNPGVTRASAEVVVPPRSLAPRP
jgi:peptidyl-prolyl cis-trans isomerase SurA